MKACKILEVPRHHWLVGSHEGLVYFVTRYEHERQYYLAFRDDIELVALICFMWKEDMEYVLVVDLHSDTMLFERPLGDLGIPFGEHVAAVIGEGPSCLVWKHL